MTAHTTQIERRAHQRFKPKEGAVAVLMNPSPRPFRILDIGRGGLSLCYATAAEPSTPDIADRLLNLVLLIGAHLDASQGPKGSLELDILLADGGFYLERIPFETIFEDRMAGSAPVNRRGLRFDRLAGSQLAQLDYFLAHHTSGRV